MSNGTSLPRETLAVARTAPRGQGTESLRPSPANVERTEVFGFRNALVEQGWWR